MKDEILRFRVFLPSDLFAFIRSTLLA